MTYDTTIGLSGEELRGRAARLIPGGCHTYAKGDDQFPAIAPPFIVRGSGSHVWSCDGREYIEYGMGLRAVTLGHAFPPILEAAIRELAKGSNFTRPSPVEVECAECLLEMVPGAEMVKFCKDGSHAVDGAIRLARAFTGRDLIAVCGDHPFFSTSDWFIGTTEMSAGIPDATKRLVLKFRYNDIDDLEALFALHPKQIACVIMEAARTEEPHEGYLAEVRKLADRYGAVLVFDEMITGFRWHNGGAQGVYKVTPDLSTFGKALANGFSVSALCGRRELMKLGGSQHDRERVFLLSTTHGAEAHELAAALATMKYYQAHPVVGTLYERGARLRAGFVEAVCEFGLYGHVEVVGRDCNLLFVTRDAEGRPSQALRALFMQELVRHGVLAPSFVVSYSHSEDDIDKTVDAVRAALRVYGRALEDGVEKYLVGRPVMPVFRRHG
ncbi:glutamate-1-semialdehyde 2,1-aminomutase [Thioalkalicoccus limnaeus]|uniref:Glutamate-1-semialdehyde 2,1-aminomutase n=1 Tax=Thioalkalicoccus limnaeus TaxID=120681 RepID=A0ABV4BCQ6_9GAMM